MLGPQAKHACTARSYFQGTPAARPSSCLAPALHLACAFRAQPLRRACTHALTLAQRLQQRFT